MHVSPARAQSLQRRFTIEPHDGIPVPVPSRGAPAEKKAGTARPIVAPDFGQTCATRTHRGSGQCPLPGKVGVAPPRLCAGS